VNISSKTLAIGVIAVGGLVIGAYMMGSKQAEPTAPTSVAVAPAGTPVPGHPGGVPPVNNLLPSDAAPATARFVHFRVGNRNVKGMMADGDEVWVGTSGGVIRYNIKTDDYKLYDVKNGNLISNGVFHVSKRDGKVWVGTYGGGLSVYDIAANTWTNYNIPAGLADQFVYDVEKDTNGDYWIATWSGANRVKGGRLDDPKAWETFTVANTQGGLPNDWVYGIEVGKHGEIWFATEGGLARLQDGKWSNWNHEAGLGAKYEVVKDDIAFSNDPAKASKHHAKQKKEQGLSDVKVGFNPNYIVSMAIDDDGSVWAGTWGGGLSHFDGKTWKTYTVKDGLPGNHVFMLRKDPGKPLWIGTNKGLARLQPDGSFKVMTTRDGLFADNVFSMAEASDGSLWIGSFGGVARIYKYN